MVLAERLPCGCPRSGYARRAAGAYAVSRCSYLPSCALGTHAHGEDRIVLTLRGAFDSTYASRTFALDAWSAIYRPAQIEHRDTYPDASVCLAIHVPAGEHGHADTFAVGDEELPSITRRLSAELDATDASAELVIEGLSAQITGRLLSSCERSLPGLKWLRQVHDRLEDEWAHPPTLSEIATTVDRATSHVANAFKRTYGKSIGEYVRDVRIWRTRKLVEDGSISLADLAQHAGFADQSHFARLFKRHFRMTPGEYRRRRAEG
jgi:AraC family transcriptional regulator